MSKKHSNDVIYTNKYKCPCLPQSSSENGWSLREQEDIALLVTPDGVHCRVIADVDQIVKARARE